MNQTTVAYIGSFAQKYIALFAGILALNHILQGSSEYHYAAVLVIVLLAAAAYHRRPDLSADLARLDLNLEGNPQSFLGRLGDQVRLSATTKGDFTAVVLPPTRTLFPEIEVRVPQKEFGSLQGNENWRADLGPRLRFIIAHEIGHVVFKDAGRLRFLAGIVLVAFLLSLTAASQVLLEGSITLVPGTLALVAICLACAASQLMTLREAEYYADRFAVMVCGEQVVIDEVRKAVVLSKYIRRSRFFRITHPSWERRLRRLTADRNFLPAVLWVGGLLVVLLLLYGVMGGSTVAGAVTLPLTVTQASFLLGPLGPLIGLPVAIFLMVIVIWWWAFGLVAAWSHFSYEAASSKNGTMVLLLLVLALCGYFAFTGTRSWTIFQLLTSGQVQADPFQEMALLTELASALWGLCLVVPAIISAFVWAALGSRMLRVEVGLATRRRSVALIALWIAFYPLFIAVGFLSLTAAYVSSGLMLLAFLLFATRPAERPDVSPFSHLRGADKLFGADWGPVGFIERLGIAVSLGGPVASFILAVVGTDFPFIGIFEAMILNMVLGVSLQVLTTLVLYRVVQATQARSRSVTSLLWLLDEPARR